MNYYALSTLPCKLINGGETLKIINSPFPAVGGGTVWKKAEDFPANGGALNYYALSTLHYKLLTGGERHKHHETAYLSLTFSL